MELGLSLGEGPAAKRFFLADGGGGGAGKSSGGRLDLGFCMGLGMATREMEEDQLEDDDEVDEEDQLRESSGDPPLQQLELLPFSPVGKQAAFSQLGLPWQLDHDGRGGGGVDVNRAPATEEEAAAGASTSSPNSGMSSFQMDFIAFRTAGEAERASSRASDEEENGLTRKKLRLSKEQSAYLEESFKEHHTLNPKQKLALASQLNLRPRQVEVWFQNRRARTKLKQTEVDCEYLKRCCEKLTEENRRLQKELQELRALKTAHPFYRQLPATTLTMCPSCERVASASTNANPPNAAVAGGESQAFPVMPRFFPFGAQSQNLQSHQSSAAS